MDRKIEKKKWTFKRIATYGGIAIGIIFVGYQLLFADRRSRLRVDKDKITIAKVYRGVYKDFIPQTGIVQPAHTVYLDAIEGGTIKKVVAVSGALLKTGDEVVELRNLNRELQVLEQESTFNESINRVRETRLTILQNDLTEKTSLAAIDNQLDVLKPKYERMKELRDKNLIAQQDFEQVKADYEYNLKRKDLTYQAYKIDSLNRSRQLSQLDDSEQRMLENLAGVSKLLDNLIIRAPIDGRLSRPELEVGQSIQPGERLGSIDEVGSYKVQVPIDELYLPRISSGLKASADYNNKTYDLVITYVYPTVQNGRFNVDMNFTGDVPSDIRVGMSLRMHIELGQPSEELLLPVGGFYKDTGGNWVFVVNKAGNQAVRRDVKFGRKNSEDFEVLDGLEEGDEVIVSSYENFGNNEVLILN